MIRTLQMSTWNPTIQIGQTFRGLITDRFLAYQRFAFINTQQRRTEKNLNNCQSSQGGIYCSKFDSTNLHEIYL